METIGIALGENNIQIADSEKISTYDSLKDKEPVQDILSSDKVKIFYDSKSAIKSLKSDGLEIRGPIFDISIAEELIGEKNETPEIVDFISRREDLVKKITENNLIEVCKLEFDCVFAVVEMELSGIKLDFQKWNKLSDKYLERQTALNDELVTEFDILDLNLNSPQQMMKAFESKGLYLKSTSHHELSEYRDIPVVTKFLEYRQVAKALQAFLVPIPKYINPATGRIYPKFNQLGASSGRFSSDSPNIQQIPRDKEFRECFIPEKGNKFIIADYSQIELRVASEIANDEVMRDAYIKGIDLHSLTASIVIGKPLAEITKFERQAAKAMNFGLIYGMGAKGFQIYAKSTYGVTMSLKEAKTFRDKFFEAYKGITKWHEETDRMINVLEYRTLSGRRVKFSEQPNISTRLNIPVQGTAADIVKRALGSLVPVVKELSGHIIATVHDEILLEIPEKRAEEASKELKNVMENAGAYYIKKVPIIAETVIADSWAEK